jgi:phage baseplate assembly protein W
MGTFIGFSTQNKRTGTKVLEDKALAKQDLLNHFYTRKGERLGSPEFGSILPDLLFDQFEQDIIDIADEDVREIIALDPRWDLIDYEISTTIHSLTITITLRYKPNLAEDILILKYQNKEEL